MREEDDEKKPTKSNTKAMTKMSKQIKCGKQTHTDVHGTFSMILIKGTALNQLICTISNVNVHTH